MLVWDCYVANISAKKEKAKARPWLPFPLPQTRWTQCYRETAREKKEKNNSLTFPGRNRMLARKFRVPLSQFNFSKAHIVKKGPFMVYSLPNATPHNRFAVVISSKLKTNSVLRHKIKRNVLVKLTDHQSRTTATDVVFLIKDKIGETKKIIQQKTEDAYKTL